MLLRRMTEHVRAQNWTAVGLDFVIVVLGVFISTPGGSIAASRRALCRKTRRSGRPCGCCGPGDSLYAVPEFHRDRFFEDAGIDGSLEIMQGANANLYEVVHMQRELAREIEPLIARRR